MTSTDITSPPRHRRKDTTLYKKSNRGSQVICLPFPESDYIEIVHDGDRYKSYVAAFAASCPELFPSEISSGFRLDDKRHSKRLDLPYRRIVCGGKKYTIQPSFVTPYWTALCEEVWYPLLLLHYHVPYWLLTLGFGRQDDFWYRLHLHLGRFNIVSTTARRTGEVPVDLVADEKISWWNGKEMYVCTTAASNCIWGANPMLRPDTPSLTKGYGVFLSEAQALDTDYQPQSVNTDGWSATRKAWKNLCGNILLVLCFLHGYLKVRETARKTTQKDELFTRIWEAYEQDNQADFSQKIDELVQWAEEHIEHPSTLKRVQKLGLNKDHYAQAYRREQAHRTSNMVDRPMRRMDRFLFINQYFHGHFSQAQLLTRAFAVVYNFAPFCPRYFYRHPHKSKYLDSRAAQYNQFKYHDNWLQNLLISASCNKIEPTP